MEEECLDYVRYIDIVVLPRLPPTRYLTHLTTPFKSESTTQSLPVSQDPAP